LHLFEVIIVVELGVVLKSLRFLRLEFLFQLVIELLNETNVCFLAEFAGQILHLL